MDPHLKNYPEDVRNLMAVRICKINALNGACNILHLLNDGPFAKEQTVGFEDVQKQREAINVPTAYEAVKQSLFAYGLETTRYLGLLHNEIQGLLIKHRLPDPGFSDPIQQESYRKLIGRLRSQS